MQFEWQLEGGRQSIEDIESHERRQCERSEEERRHELIVCYKSPRISKKSTDEIMELVVRKRAAEDLNEEFERNQLEECHHRYDIYQTFLIFHLRLRSMLRAATNNTFTVLREIIPPGAFLVEHQLKESHSRTKLTSTHASELLRLQDDFNKVMIAIFDDDFNAGVERIKLQESQSLSEGLEDHILLRRNEILGRQLIVNSERSEYKTIIRICDRINMRPLRRLAAKALCDHSMGVVLGKYFNLLRKYYRTMVAFKYDLKLARHQLECSAMRIRSKFIVSEQSRRKILRAGCRHARRGCKQSRRVSTSFREPSYTLSCEMKPSFR
eukprot:TRINITY_DN30433_c0_g1_i1.p1 TRINITY_DN30433_c0_g1~~TRINITY_DN30433_c0_g1_i1.p1  ORF type:complete len:325 (+),score=47.98 TRINITY_DN30433_c0_g1_i1:78-1052(+)